MDYLELGPVPADEQCEQLGPNYRADIARKECNIFIRQIRRLCGPEPEGAKLVVRSNLHDAGTYHEVAVKFDDSVEEAVQYAYKCESEYPGNWDDEALKELEKSGIYGPVTKIERL